MTEATTMPAHAPSPAPKSYDALIVEINAMPADLGELTPEKRAEIDAALAELAIRNRRVPSSNLMMMGVG